jgi:DNA mismatch endonuclease (patch repair protein)
MTDNRTKEQRSHNMSMIRSTNTKPELLVRKYLFSQGFRYRLHSKNLVGKPDIVLPKHRAVVFVHGCFWHGHTSCKFAKVPVSNKSFWFDKIEKNKERDKRSIHLLKIQGWRVLILWECQLGKTKAIITLDKLVQKLLNKNSYFL